MRLQGPSWRIVDYERPTNKGKCFDCLGIHKSIGIVPRVSCPGALEQMGLMVLPLTRRRDETRSMEASKRLVNTIFMLIF